MTEETKKEKTLKRPYSVYVVGGGYDYLRMMWELGYNGARQPEEADLILFTGGADVDPSFYNEGKLKTTMSNPDRDRREAWIYNAALEKNIPMVGICRGGQFLNVMNGGKMWQHVNNHTVSHDILEVLPKNAKRAPRFIPVTSTHHQMMIPSDKATILAVGTDKMGNPLCSSRMSFAQEVQGTNRTKYPDFEVLFYEGSKSLCFQPHPEFTHAPKECTQYFDELLEDYVIPHCP